MSTHDLFREFLLSGYRERKARAKYVAEAFSLWLERNHLEHGTIDGRRVASILKKWGPSNSIYPFASAYWFLGNDHICDKRGGHRVQNTDPEGLATAAENLDEVGHLLGWCLRKGYATAAKNLYNLLDIL